MLVSCVIPTFKQFDYLKETLSSIFNQTYEEIEIIIADDGSPNFDSIDIKSYIESKKGENIKGYKIITQHNNVGTVKNMNCAIQKCSGDIIMPIASDDVFYSNEVISKVVCYFKESSCEVMSCARVLYDHNLQKPIRQIPHKSYIKYILKNLNSADKQYKAMALGHFFELASGSAMYYRADYIKRHLYDERYILWEDGPFIARTAREGVKIEPVYNIIAIKYRSGGISSKYPSKESSIYKDYCNQILWEFLEYPDRFTKIQRCIIKGRYDYLSNYYRWTINFIMHHKLFALDFFITKLRKFLYRLFC